MTSPTSKGVGVGAIQGGRRCREPRQKRIHRQHVPRDPDTHECDSGFAQLMRRNSQLTREQQEHLAIINRNGEHLLELINDILEISKIEASRVALRTTAFSPGKLVSELAGSLRPRTEQKGLGLEVALASDLFASVTADKLKVRQILLNLASNASKFTEKEKLESQRGVRLPQIAKVGCILKSVIQGPGSCRRVEEPLPKLRANRLG